ncbi:MAG: hypothetical protein NVSMB9_35240 [Isosphaeraceae bacterium]
MGKYFLPRTRRQTFLKRFYAALEDQERFFDVIPRFVMLKV